MRCDRVHAKLSLVSFYLKFAKKQATEQYAKVIIADGFAGINCQLVQVKWRAVTVIKRYRFSLD